MPETLRYPFDDADDYEGAVVFEVVDEDAMRFVSSQNSAAETRTSFSDTEVDEYIESRKGILDQIGGIASDLLATGTEEQSAAQISEEREKARKEMMDLRAVKGTAPTAKSRIENVIIKDTAYRVKLYLPQAFQIQDQVNFENFELGILGATAERAMKEAGAAGRSVGILGAAKQGISASMGAGASLLASGGQLDINNSTAALVAAQTIQKLGNVPIVGAAAPAVTAAVRSTAGVQVNPNLRALFKDVPLRQFNFAFTMIPTSRAEASTVRKIIRHFREEMYPEGLDYAGINYGYKFPNRFLIRAQYKRADIPGIKFVPAYLTSVSTAYNDQTMGMHDDGHFTSTTISLSFTESKPLMKQHIKENY